MWPSSDDDDLYYAYDSIGEWEWESIHGDDDRYGYGDDDYLAYD